MVPICSPLPHVSDRVLHAESVRPCVFLRRRRVHSHHARIGGSKRPANPVSQTVPPRIRSGRSVACRALPLRLRRETSTTPAAVCVSLEPCDSHNRVIPSTAGAPHQPTRTSRIAVPPLKPEPRPDIISVPPLTHKRFECIDGHLGSVDGERADLYCSNRLLIGRTGTAALKRACRHIDPVGRCSSKQQEECGEHQSP